jgi:Transposase and inactivated derivatives
MLDQPEHPVSRWAVTLQINKSGYYAWRNGLKAREERRANIKKRIGEAFEKSRKTYGPDRIVMELRKMGEKLGRRRCAAYMREMGLKSIHNRRRTRSLTDSRKARGDGYPNILRYESFPIVPRMGLVGDITYLRTGEGFMYYCMIKDVVTGEVLGDQMSERMTTELVIDAMSAVRARHTLEDGCIFHSDRGSQYTSKAFMEYLSRHGIRQSFSRIGKPGDNSWSESFFATMKKERVHWTFYRTKESIRAAVFEYVHCFYNGTRTQKRLGYLSPRQLFNSLNMKRMTVNRKKIVA